MSREQHNADVDNAMARLDREQEQTEHEEAQGVLRYRNRQMFLRVTQRYKGHDYGIDFKAMRKDLIERAGFAYHMFVEPGDATRYEFVLVPLYSGPTQRGLMVTSMRSGSPHASYVLWDWDKWASTHHLDEAAARLAGTNPWSIALTRWFLGHLCNEYPTTESV